VPRLDDILGAERAQPLVIRSAWWPETGGPRLRWPRLLEELQA
jgi:hypothetical protein